MAEYKTYEYIWLDGYQPEANMRSKVKATEADTPPDWSFDGSSTQQAEGGSSDCLLLPVQTYANPNGHDIVMTEVQAADHTTHPSNYRAAAAEVVTDECTVFGVGFVVGVDLGQSCDLVGRRETALDSHVRGTPLSGLCGRDWPWPCESG